MSQSAPTFSSEHFLNRELSWLAFNQRVLDEALNPATPLLERVKFFCITSSNLDEFFEVRVAGLKQQIESDVVERSADGLTASECFRAVRDRVRVMVAAQFRCWREELLPALAANGIRFLDYAALDATDRLWAESYYLRQIGPVLTPLGLDPSHPFPQLLNKTLNLIVQVETANGQTGESRLAVVQVPRSLPRLVKLPRDDSRQDYIPLAYLVGAYLQDLFPGTRILGHWQFRVTRNSELYLDEEDSPNLLKAVEEELHNRRRGEAVRLEVSADCPPEIRDELLDKLHLTEDDLHVIDGPINPVRLLAILDGDHSPELRDPPFLPPIAPALRDQPDLFAAIRERDVLLHHPFDSFGSVVEFLARAAADPEVLAIKMTLYRTGGDARIVGALMDAARAGKEVTAVVELKARFDEANNIAWARRLEEAGVHVVYGLVGLKIHAKMILVVRRDADRVRRYAHLGTGNYNPATSRFYTDLGLFTCRKEIGEDLAGLFNLLTGICQFQPTRRLLVAPFELHERIHQLIEREAEHARRGLPARIIAKMNSLVHRETIEALYRASQAGVKIDLIVRGICCLRPGVPGLSENITVRSIVDRFLEHSRLFYFENACRPEVFLSSADWMPRNFHRRIEIAFPIEDGGLLHRLKRDILDTLLADNVKARHLQPDGTYITPPLKRGQRPHRSQSEFMAAALPAPAAPAPAQRKPRRTRTVRLRSRP